MTKKNQAAVELGRRGGLKTLVKYGKNHFKEMRAKVGKRPKKLSTVKDLTQPLVIE